MKLWRYALALALLLAGTELALAQIWGGGIAVGTSGGTVCLLNSACTWTGLQTLNGGINMDAATAPDLSDQKGTANNFYGTCCADPVFTATEWNLSQGTAASPVTTSGPALKISRTRNFAGTNCGSNATNADCSTALDVTELCAATDAINCNGITGNAVVQSTTAPGGNGQGVQGRCDLIGSVGNTVAAGCEGGYFLARADGSHIAVPSSAYLDGIETSAWNQTGTNAPSVSGTASSGYNGIAINARGNAIDSSGIEIESADGVGQWQDGISNKILSSVSETVDFLKDYASEPTVFIDVGSHTNGMDMSGGTYTGNPFKAPAATASDVDYAMDGANNGWYATGTANAGLAIGGTLRFDCAITTAATCVSVWPLEVAATSSVSATAYGLDAVNNGWYSTSGSNAGLSIAGTKEFDCAVTTAATCTSIWPLTTNGLLTGTLGATISGATTAINGSSNFNTNINTGSSTGTVNIGNSAASITAAGTMLFNNSINDNTSINTGTSTGTLTLGNGSATTLVNGTLTLNFGVNDNTSINGGTTTGNVSIESAAGSSGTITIGNSSNTGKTSLLGISTGTNADVLCLSSGGVVQLQAAASCTISSLRFKRDVHIFSGAALSMLGNLNVDTFWFKAKNRDPNGNDEQLGLIAEDVAKKAPLCALYENDMKTPKSYKQDCIIGLLVKGMQEQQAEIAGLKKQVAMLEARH